MTQTIGNGTGVGEPVGYSGVIQGNTSLTELGNVTNQDTNVRVGETTEHRVRRLSVNVHPVKQPEREEVDHEILAIDQKTEKDVQDIGHQIPLDVQNGTDLIAKSGSQETRNTDFRGLRTGPIV